MRLASALATSLLAALGFSSVVSPVAAQTGAGTEIIDTAGKPRGRAEGLKALQEPLSPGQWEKVPPRIKSPQIGLPGGMGPGAGPGGAGQRPRP